MLPLWNKKENLISKLKNTSGEHAATSFIKYPPPSPKKKKIPNFRPTLYGEKQVVIC